MRQELQRQLTGDEDRKTCAYKDSLGLLTIGIGRLIDPSKPGAGLRPDEIDYLFNNDLNDRIDQLTRRIPWFALLDDVRKGVLVNMAFQMGVDGLMEFQNTLTMIRLGRYGEAADAMLESKWARQTPNRAKRMSDQMRTGQWQYAQGT